MYHQLKYLLQISFNQNNKNKQNHQAPTQTCNTQGKTNLINGDNIKKVVTIITKTINFNSYRLQKQKDKVVANNITDFPL